VTPAEESDLIRAVVIDNDQPACVVLHGHLRPYIVNILTKTLRTCPWEVEDAVQETFVRVFKALPKFQGKAGLSTWVYRVALNQGLMVLRRRKEGTRYGALRNAVSLDTNPTVAPGNNHHHSTSLEPRDTRRPIQAVLAAADLDRILPRLSTVNRRALELYYIGGTTLQETADVEGCTLPAMKSRVYHALEEARLVLRNGAPRRRGRPPKTLKTLKNTEHHHHEGDTP
jgi:RNA polymerase sigma-70 factor (ECF subfamily)